MPFVTATAAGGPKQKIEFATVDGALPGIEVPKTTEQINSKATINRKTAESDIRGFNQAKKV